MTTTTRSSKKNTKSKKSTSPATRPATRVDPRLAKRRVEIKRDEGRRRLRTLLALVVVTLATIGGIALVNSSLLDVDGIEVAGVTNTDPESVKSATGILLGDPLLDVDFEGAARSVERLPWVLQATVGRSWDGTVLVEITERTPATVLNAEDGFVLIDQSGRQLEVVERRPPGYLPIAGITADGEVGQPAPPAAQAVLRLMSELQPQLEAEVAQLVIDESVLYLDLTSGGRVKLGDDSALDEKVISLETILANVDLRCLWEIDVRVPSAPAVTRMDADGNPRATLTDLANCS